MVSQRFLGKEIQVKVAGEVRQPVSFTLEGKEYTIAEIVAEWADHGFGSAPSGRQRWWMRHHRNYYQVRTTEGEVFEIYYDRGTSLKNTRYKKWYATRQLEAQKQPQDNASTDE